MVHLHGGHSTLCYDASFSTKRRGKRTGALFAPRECDGVTILHCIAANYDSSGYPHVNIRRMQMHIWRYRRW